jgi:hypothetical protein
MPLSTEQRRDLRLWRQAVGENQSRLRAVISAPATLGLCREFTGRSSVKGRRRVAERLIEVFQDVATFEVGRLKGPRPRLMWSTVSPDDADGARVDYVGLGATSMSMPFSVIAFACYRSSLSNGRIRDRQLRRQESSVSSTIRRQVSCASELARLVPWLMS